MSNLKTLSVFIPLYNEEDGIENLYIELENFHKKIVGLAKPSIVLVNDGSTDSTSLKLSNLFKDEKKYKIINHKKNKNLGGFLETALKNCKSEYIGFLDSDCSYNPELLIKMFEKTISGYDVVNASPYHPDGKVIGVEKYRIFLSKKVNKIYGKIIDRKIYTASSICKIYKFSAIQNIEITRNNFVAITELFVKTLSNNNLKYYEYPCILKPRIYGNSKMNVFSNIKDHLKFLIYLKKNI